MLLDQLLWKGKNRWQIAGAAIGAFLGLLLLLLALQLYLDLRGLINGNATSDQYVLINKQVSVLNTLGGVGAAFNEEDLVKINDQPFIESVGKFTSNRFRVSASSQMLGFYTELFFESVPEEFIDLESYDWKWEPGQEALPIILSRDYLALYNFGFAPSQGLPQFTPSTIRRVSVDITVKGRGMRKVYQGKIVGFSDRINSILVPQEFLEWNNEKFGESDAKASSRLILKTDNPYSAELQNFLKENAFEVSSGKLIGGQITAVLKSIITVVALIGGIIVLLSVLIFILNFQLIISKSKEDIRLLLQLGYKSKDIGQKLGRVLYLLFGGILIVTFLVLLISRFFFTSWVNEQGFDLSTNLHWVVYLVALLFSLLFLFLNTRNIRHSILKLV